MARAKRVNRAQNNQFEASDAEYVDVFPTALGWMGLCWQGEQLLRVTFGHDSPQAAAKAIEGQGIARAKPPKLARALRQRFTAFARGKADDFHDVPLALGQLTEFQAQVVAQCRRIRFGKTLSYAELAAKAGSPRAARAVGNIMRANRLPLVVPCHRVVGSGGKLGGYSAPQGLTMKRRLLELEQQG